MSSRCYLWEMTEKQYPSDKQDKFMLRFPDGMRDRIREEAEANGRSMNAEIILRLEASLAGDAVLSDDLPTAEEALALAASSQSRIKLLVQEYFFEQIMDCISGGGRETTISLDELLRRHPDIDEHSDTNQLKEIVDAVIEKIMGKGYKVEPLDDAYYYCVSY